MLTHRSVPAVAAPIAPARLVHYERDPEHPDARAGARAAPESDPVAEFLAEHDIVVNCILQDTDEPLMFVTRDELELFAPGSLFVDVSCDEGMGFEWARPTSFADPMFTVGSRRALLRRRPQPVVPVELGDVGDQRGADPVPRDRDGRRRRLGRRPDDPPGDRDPRRRGAEPEDPVVPVPLADVPPREASDGCCLGAVEVVSATRAETREARRNDQAPLRPRRSPALDPRPIFWKVMPETSGQPTTGPLLAAGELQREACRGSRSRHRDGTLKVTRSSLPRGASRQQADRHPLGSVLS